MQDKKYIYCQVCGKQYKDPEAKDQLKCSSCGFIFYKNSIPATSIILYDGDKVLLVRRAIEPKRGKWDFPGGFLKNGEHPADGLKREIKEELTVDIEIEDHLGIYLDKYIYDSANNLATMCIYYVGKIAGGSIKTGDDVASAQWFSEDDFPWSDLAVVGARDTARDYFKIRMNRKPS